MNSGVAVDDVERIDLFADLGTAALAEITAVATRESRGPAEALVHQGQPGDRVYVVVDGEASVFIDGQPITPGVGPGDCVGELAVLDGSPRAATVTTACPTTLLAFEAADFQALVQTNPLLRDRVTRGLTRRLRQVSSGWIRLAADTDLLLDACLAIQDRAEGVSREEAVAQAASLLRQLAVKQPASVTEAEDRLAPLTPAERRVASLVADGLSNAAIAAQLYVSRHTVESHLKHVFAKLDISSRVSLAALVIGSP